MQRLNRALIGFDRALLLGYFVQLADGRLLVANWQGHGPDNGHKGCQLLEFDAQRHLRSNWSGGERISSLQGILAL